MSTLGDSLRSLEGPVLITGHTGFKGTWLSILFESLEIPVVGFSLPALSDSLYIRAERLGKIPEFFGDITSIETIEEVFNKFNPSCIIHMAAESLVLASYKKPINTFNVNVMGTANILEVATRQPSVRISACITSDKVYENLGKSKAFNENDKIGGLDPYSASKSAAESVITAWRNLSSERNGSKVLSFRAGNVIGGGDLGQNRLIPDIIRSIYHSEDLTIRNLNSTRPWQHVLDPLNGYIMGIEHSLNFSSSEIFSLNFGPNEPSKSVGEILQIAEGFFGVNHLRYSVKNSAQKEEVSLSLDSSKANIEIGWKPKFNQETAVLKTLDWWEKNLKSDLNANALCRKDIYNFLDL
jgi:CDP-glucose 4,6-dehydratase